MSQNLFADDTATQTAAGASRSLAGKRILVVDDNPINLDIAAETLLTLGATVDTAAGGADALTLIEEVRYDLVLLDLSMPDVDGIQVGRAIRKSTANSGTAVLLFTAADTVEARRAAANINAQGFITKPVDIDDLSAQASKHA